MMKRLIAMMTVLVVFLSVFYGCSKEDEHEEISTIEETFEEVSIIPRTTKGTTETTEIVPNIERETITLESQTENRGSTTISKIVVLDMTQESFKGTAIKCLAFLKKEGKISPEDSIYVVGGDLKGAESINGFTIINALTTILKEKETKGKDFIIISNLDFTSTYYIPYDVSFESGTNVFVYAKSVRKSYLNHIQSKLSDGLLTLVEIA